MESLGDWSSLYSMRREVRTKFRRIWDVPLIKKELDRLIPNIKDGSSVLEVGAGDRRFEPKLKAARKGVTYKSMDIDRSTTQDYYDLADITERFDCIYMFEVIEHLTPEEGLNILIQLRNLLNPGGVIIVGTPNLYHPHRYFGDITHKTPYKYEELGALMMMAGFKNLGFFRIYNDAFLRRAFRLTIGLMLHRYLDIDFAGTVLAEGVKV